MNKGNLRVFIWLTFVLGMATGNVFCSERDNLYSSDVLGTPLNSFYMMCCPSVNAQSFAKYIKDHKLVKLNSIYLHDEFITKEHLDVMENHYKRYLLEDVIRRNHYNLDENTDRLYPILQVFRGMYRGIVLPYIEIELQK